MTATLEDAITRAKQQRDDLSIVFHVVEFTFLDNQMFDVVSEHYFVIHPSKISLFETADIYEDQEPEPLLKEFRFIIRRKEEDPIPYNLQRFHNLFNVKQSLKGLKQLFAKMVGKPK